MAHAIGIGTATLVGVVALDQASKHHVRATVDPRAPWGGIVVNRSDPYTGMGTGSARSIEGVVAPAALALGIGAATPALVRLVAPVSGRIAPVSIAAGGAALVGGVLSNTVDRSRAGEVTNILRIPIAERAVNVADVAIGAGALTLIGGVVGGILMAASRGRIA